MTEFSTDELVDCIRHNIALLDDSGLADRVLLSPRRHAVPGGLPLELCQRYGEEEEAGPSFSHFELEKHYKNQELYSKTSSKISQKIHDKLLAQLNEIESIGRFDKQAFLSHQVPSCTLNFESKNIQEIYDGQKSLTSRLIAKAKCNVITDNSPPFIEFAKFEAMEDTVGAKRFRIVFHSVNSKEKSHILTINILKTAFIDDLIGLACHIYTRKMLNPSCESPSMYDLYLAEEDLSDFDIELPPLDRKRRVAECGFLNLAIIKKSFVNRRLSMQSWKQNIRIYLVDGRCYTMNNVEGISLREVFEYALQRKVKENNQTTNTEVRIQSETLFHDMEYQLEPLNSPGLVLDLNKSVSSSGIFDFILIRKNSSRGDFDTLLKNLDSSDLLNKQNIETTICFKEVDYQRPLQLISLETSSFINQNSLTDNSTSNNMEDILNGGSILEEYSVNKIRRFKPKILSRLVIRENCLELIQKGKTEKDDDLKRKIKRIPWKLVASVEVPPTSEKRHSRFVRITFFVSHNPSLLQYILKAAITDKPTQENLIFDGSYWKVLFIEAEAHEAWKIGVKLNEQLDINPSLVHLLYRYSLRTSLKPKIAAEKASIIQKQFPSSTSSSAISSISKNEKGFKKKLSAILSIKKF